MSKYGNRKTIAHGVQFDSKAEAARYCELLLLVRAGEITQLRLQPRFQVVPKVDGERAVHYIADFEYMDADGKHIVEDVKGKRTKDYVIKRKLFKWQYPHIQHIEVAA